MCYVLFVTLSLKNSLRILLCNNMLSICNNAPPSPFTNMSRSTRYKYTSMLTEMCRYNILHEIAKTTNKLEDAAVSFIFDWCIMGSQITFCVLFMQTCERIPVTLLRLHCQKLYVVLYHAADGYVSLLLMLCTNKYPSGLKLVHLVDMCSYETELIFATFCFWYVLI